MRIGVVADASVILPQRFLEENGVTILPIAVRGDAGEFVDRCIEEETLQYIRANSETISAAETAPLTSQQIETIFLERLVIDYDFVICITVMSGRSSIFDNANQASMTILSRYKQVRADAGVAGPFALRVIDSRSMFTSHGVLVAEAVRMAREGAAPNAIRNRIEELIPGSYGYLLPNSLYHIRARAATKGDKSVGWFKYMLGSALDIKPVLVAHDNETKPVASLRHFEDSAKRLFEFAEERIRAGLLTPILTLGYVGELTEMRKLPGYEDLRRTAEIAGVDVLEGVGNITAAVNVGPGSLMIGFCAPEHEFKA